ncbi:hypothetical protein E3T55_09580 [Cryobacterium frigoriphilum]|uniref:Uncharacterized protein n=1 Tax=Cryobacterium frigoriphilum TaxID=1259150 RepID=A0A4R9A2B2_9MICO|nr:hypothetical protein [Cryobacterium frigoriphilum]TFD50636.1 hypothetical protein E3T55_09580 [Cryobacterium frigoriphilum]
MIDMMVAPVFAAATFVLQNSPGSDLDPNTVTPGPIGFAAIFLVAAATVLIGFDMVRRIRRTTYRAEIKERLEAEIAAKEDKPE